jgi:hypothetical protein
MAPEKGSELAEWEAEVDDVFVPAVQRASFTKAQGGLPTTAAAGSARAASTVGRRMSSLGSLHPHAGHSAFSFCCVDGLWELSIRAHAAVVAASARGTHPKNFCFRRRG